MSEQLWHCNHFSRRGSHIRYKVVNGVLYRRSRHNSNGQEWEPMAVEFKESRDRIAVTVPAKDGVGPISFSLSKCT